MTPGFSSAPPVAAPDSYAPDYAVPVSEPLLRRIRGKIDELSKLGGPDWPEARLEAAFLRRAAEIDGREQIDGLGDLSMATAELINDLAQQLVVRWQVIQLARS
jgi:hypothetical protein